MNEQERIAELESRIAELERKLDEPSMARIFETLMTPDARTRLRALAREQLLLMAEVSRGLAELLSPSPTEPSTSQEERHSRHVPVD